METQNCEWFMGQASVLDAVKYGKIMTLEGRINIHVMFYYDS